MTREARLEAALREIIYNSDAVYQNSRGIETLRKIAEKALAD